MAFTFREIWTAIHGMALGFGFVLFFTGALALLLTLQPQLLTARGIRRNIILLKISGIAIAGLSWLAVIVGTYIVYPWYRAAPPKGTTDLSSFPRSRLLANSALSGWHNFGMEWKEHLGWLVPIIATAALFLIFRYGEHLAKEKKMRWTVFVILCIAFVLAGIVGVLGAIITKEAAVV
ncbi:MAG: hypothetical protein ABSG85_14240 [Spirochaetia bacterium]|jgi:membrane protein insertase Oxa1/YidC/SpoIIIJ